jgi:hypothetical protein
MNAFKAQQFRWTKGGAQTAIKMLPRILLSRAPLKAKVEAFFHLTCFTVHLYVIVLVALLYPVMVIRHSSGENLNVWRAMIDLTVFGMATMSASVFYVASQYELFRDWRTVMKYLPFLMALGVGVSLSNAKALLEALLGRRSEFVRTPKFGAGMANYEQTKKQSGGTRKRKLRLLPYLELGFGVYMGYCAAMSVTNIEFLMSVPFLAIFATGFFYVSLLSLHAQRASAAQPAQLKAQREASR